MQIQYMNSHTLKNIQWNVSIITINSKIYKKIPRKKPKPSWQTSDMMYAWKSVNMVAEHVIARLLYYMA